MKPDNPAYGGGLQFSHDDWSTKFGTHGAVLGQVHQTLSQNLGRLFTKRKMAIKRARRIQIIILSLGGLATISSATAAFLNSVDGQIGGLVSLFVTTLTAGATFTAGLGSVKDYEFRREQLSNAVIAVNKLASQFVLDVELAIAAGAKEAIAGQAIPDYVSGIHENLSEILTGHYESRIRHWQASNQQD